MHTSLVLDLTTSAIDLTWRSSALERQAQLTKPPGSLGRLEEVAVQLATVQRTHQPRVDHAHTLIFAADHPVARHGTSAYPVEVTAAMVGNFLAGGAASSVLARTHDIPLTVIDVGVDTPYAQPQSTPERYQRYQLRGGDLSEEPALDLEDFYAAVKIGRQCVAALDPELNLLILGEMGIGNTTPSAAIACALLSGDVDELVGRGTGIDEDARVKKQEVITRSLKRWRAAQASGAPQVAEVLRHLGGREIVAIFGAMLESVQRGVAILVDGFIISAAALALVTMYPEARPFLLFSHRSRERGHRRLLEAMDALPLLELDLRLGEASGALTAYPLVRAACALHCQMATFAEAAVPDRDDAL